MLIAFLLSSCVTLPDPETTQDFSKDSIATVTAEQTVGQTFVSRRPELNSIDLWLESGAAGSLHVELFHQPDDTAPIFTGFFRVQGGKNRIQIPSLDDPPNQTYYLRLSADTAEIAILGRDEDAYAKGTAYINDQPLEADLAFRASYEYDVNAVWADIQEMLSIGWMILPLGFVLFLPGWLLLDFAGWKAKFDPGETIAVSLGLSLAVIPILMLWTSSIGLHWGRISLWVVVGVLIALAIWRWFQQSNKKPGMNDDLPIEENAVETNLQVPTPDLRASFLVRQLGTILLFLIFALTLLTRFAMVRDLAAPPWVDSIHHNLITRLMMESGGIPDTYAPYLPPEADYYHFGFHSSLACFIWLTGLEIYQATLIFGQVLNALIVFAIYLLTKTLTKSRPTALTTALISGLFTLMPAYYVSWGRYTQLAGLLILPVGFTWIKKIFKADDSPISKKNWFLTAVICAGLFLVHYRVAAFLGLMVAAYGLAQINPQQWLKALGKTIFLSVIIALLLLPWIPGTIAGLLIPKGQSWSGGENSFSPIPWSFLKPGLGETALVLAVIGLLFGVILLKRFTITVLLWTGLIYLVANLRVVGLPGSGFVNPVSMEISLFIPISILGGFAVGGALELFDRFAPVRWRVWPRLIFIGLGVWGAILGAQRLLPTLNPITFLAREADFTAIEWIKTHIPEDETILINPTGWGYGLYMGNDGGYWISPLSGQQTMPPAVLYGLGNREEITKINRVIEQVLPIGEDATALRNLMQAEGMHFVFTGGRGGIISPKTLEASELFETRYQQDGTWLFEAVNVAP